MVIDEYQCLVVLFLLDGYSAVLDGVSEVSTWYTTSPTPRAGKGGQLRIMIAPGSMDAEMAFASLSRSQGINTSPEWVE